MWWHFGIQIICSVVHLPNKHNSISYLRYLFYFACLLRALSVGSVFSSIDKLLHYMPSIHNSMLYDALSTLVSVRLVCVFFSPDTLVFVCVCAFVSVCVCVCLWFECEQARAWAYTKTTAATDSYASTTNEKRYKIAAKKKKNKIGRKKSQRALTHTLAHTRAKYTDITRHKYQARLW